MLLAAPELPSRAARDGRLGFAGAHARRERAATIVTDAADLALRHARRRGALLFVIGPHARERSVAEAHAGQSPSRAGQKAKVRLREANVVARRSSPDPYRCVLRCRG